MVPRLFIFSKEERLRGRDRVSELFSRGERFVLYPFKILYIERPENSLNKLLVTVPKRVFSKANVRNKIKRRVREAYRLNKAQFPSKKKFDIGLIYISKEVLTYSFIEKKLLEAFHRFKSI